MENNNITADQQEKTFTQDELNAIIGKRLSEKKQQQEAELIKREEELKKREMNIRANELLMEKGLPKSLGAVLKYDTEEELVKAIEILEQTRGFKQEKEPEYEVLVNRLPERRYDDDDFMDPVHKAFLERE